MILQWRTVRILATCVEWGLVFWTLSRQLGEVSSWPRALAARIWKAATVVPEPPSWKGVVGMTLLIAGGLAFGLGSGFLRKPINPCQKDCWKAVQGMFFVLLTPGLSEEVWFRAALLPDGQGRSLPDAFIALIAFLTFHLNFMHPAPLFRDIRFLSLAAIVGTGCTVAYWSCGSSLWPPVFLHGIAVWAWLFCMGGIDAFNEDGPDSPTTGKVFD
eukprot:TRINITY_DN4458_c0_g1_i2.p1 TRINITY_DN4458_c0_g1~~TRINITY_DN4458_c0_g1_i2.p1  ORF type:complete len:215 (-),score=12.47 TRINITY_DN4458_c0_g1_i2:340-984(-)